MFVCLFVWVLWHINLCRLFNTKSIFIQINTSFQRIQFSLSRQFNSIWSIRRTLSVAPTPGQSGPGSDGNEGVLQILQIASITGTSPSDCLVSYLGHPWGGLSALQRCSRCILQPRLTEQYNSREILIFVRSFTHDSPRNLSLNYLLLYFLAALKTLFFSLQLVETFPRTLQLERYISISSSHADSTELSNSFFICPSHPSFQVWLLDSIMTASVWPFSFHLTNHPTKMDKTCGTAREITTNSSATSSHGLLYMYARVLADQQRLTCISSEQTLDTLYISKK